MKSSCLFFLLLILSVVSETFGTSIVSDQVFEPDNSSYGRTRWIGYREDELAAQTFKVGKSGDLIAIEVLAAKEPLNSATLTLELRSTSAGAPTEGLGGIGVLAESTVDGVHVPTAAEPFNIVARATHLDARWVRFEISPIPVSVGEVLAIVLRTSNPGHITDMFYWIGGGYREYAAGAPYFYDGQSWVEEIDRFGGKVTDAGFRTYVDVVPEPRLNSMILAVGLFLSFLRSNRWAALPHCF